MRNISYYMPFGDKSARKGACYAYVWPKRAPYDEMHYGRHRRYLKHVEPDYSAVNKWRRFPEGPPQRISCAKAFKLEQADAKKTGKLDAWIKCPKGEEKWEIPSNRKSWQYGGRAVVEIENDDSIFTFPGACGRRGECKITNWVGKVISDDVRHVGSGTDNFGGTRDFYRFKLDGKVWTAWGVQGCGAYLQARRTTTVTDLSPYKRDYGAEHKGRSPALLQAQRKKLYAKRKLERAEERERLKPKQRKVLS